MFGETLLASKVGVYDLKPPDSVEHLIASGDHCYWDYPKIRYCELRMVWENTGLMPIYHEYIQFAQSESITLQIVYES